MRHLHKIDNNRHKIKIEYNKWIWPLITLIVLIVKINYRGTNELKLKNTRKIKFLKLQFLQKFLEKSLCTMIREPV